MWSTALSTGFSTESVEARGLHSRVEKRTALHARAHAAAPARAGSAFTPQPAPSQRGVPPNVQGMSHRTPEVPEDVARHAHPLLLGLGRDGAAVVNTVAPGEPMLTLVAGHFGRRWAEIGKAHGR